MWRRISLLLSTLLALSHGFAWDEFNVNRLFNNSEDIFAGLTVTSDERQCVDSFKAFVSELKSGEGWAVKVIDTWAKEPSGLSSDVNFGFGHYDQCVELQENFEKQLCEFRVENGRNSSYVLSLCVPDSCSKATLDKLLRPFLANVELKLHQVGVCTSETTPPFGALQWSVLVLCFALILLALGSTAAELLGGRGLLVSWSLFRNTNRLMEAKSGFGPMNCLNGIRVYSMLWIVMLHSYHEYLYTYSLINPNDLKRFNLSLGRAIFHHGDLAVDTFFVIGGLLLAYNFFKSRENGENFNYFKFVLHRYLRLIPVFAVVMLVVLAFAEYTSSGPKAHEWKDTFMVNNCKEYWWSALLLLQNYINPDKLCIIPSWYISADFQLYVLSPLILYPLLKWGRKFLPVMLLISSASMVFMFVWSFQHDLHFNNYRTPGYRKWVYYATHGKVAQWLLGVALGYVLWNTRNKEIKIRKSLNVGLWVLSLGTMMAIIMSAWTQVRDQTEATLGFAFFAGFHRQLWALAVAWISFACIKGYGGPVNWLLSFPFYQPLAKLSYAIYMIHFPLKLQIASWQRSLVYFNEYLMFHFFLGLFLMSLLFAIPTTLLVEVPVANAETEIYKLARRETDSGELKSSKSREDEAKLNEIASSSQL